MRTIPRIRVMIVDDVAGVRQDLRTFLEAVADDLEVVGEAADGLEAVQLAEELEPDIVLLDLHMPIMDGLEAARRIKGRRLARGVILLTMFGGGSARGQAAKAGVDAYVEKATAVGTLVPTIRDVLGCA